TDAFPAASKVYVASGVVFPDALAGAVLAAKGAAPLYVSQTNCLSAGIIAGIARLGVGSVTLLGGTGSLTARVQSLTSCTS
ncbi:cell wall-binding repeat-containing protein, partial [Kitasatospora herbaricolor]